MNDRAWLALAPVSILSALYAIQLAPWPGVQGSRPHPYPAHGAAGCVSLAPS